MNAACNRRLSKELANVKTANPEGFRNLKVDEANMLKWEGLLLPEKEPYSKGAFRIRIDFPEDYPFKPPKITFLTKIYHPNVDEEGQVCLPIIGPNNWKPATKIEQVIAALVGLVHEPEPDHPLRNELAEEFQRDRKKFNKLAEDHTRKNAEKRPD